MVSTDNPRGLQAMVTTTVFCAIALVVVLMRLYTRLSIVRSLGLDDYFIAFAMMCSIGLTACIIIQVQNGMGRHIVELQPEHLVRSLKAFYASILVYSLSLGLVKLSILLQYRRVFPTKKFQIASGVVMAIVIVYTAWSVLSNVFMCIPIRAFWTKEKAKCLDQFTEWFVNAAINITTDFIIILLPMPVIRTLNLARKQKWALIGVFALGGFVCVMSIVRLHSLVAISNSADPTYDNPPAAKWSAVESNVAIICSCLPALRPLFTRYITKQTQSYFTRSSRRRRQVVLQGEETADERGVDENNMLDSLDGSTTRIVESRSISIEHEQK
ncbi:hypothetical protein CC80DRAFT_534987 [Byssothecium circinans]|uniref:Rhodopsin domain-containing protein n=1 Tax=Byssothecium circinans TaxID=147558 RepID=A0A6A5TWJ1_9PLEO|nr:hypothetical protein CC80DRAFT_534987 [Byssothecium circinans]